MTKRGSHAILALEDGSVFEGEGVGVEGVCTGELVFNTAMTGYQEIMTDPSYAGQIIVFTTPHIGNVGFNSEDAESSSLFAKAVVLREQPTEPSNWRSDMAFKTYCQEKGLICIAGVDTRALTQQLREKGAMRACIQVGECDREGAIAMAKASQDMQGQDLAITVTTREPYSWTQGLWEEPSTVRDKPPHVVVVDYGVKHQILRYLAHHGLRLTVVPASSTFNDIMHYEPDGVFLSNGPGDPAACEYAVGMIQSLLDRNMPIMGICLGYQLLALACGATTYKMPFGHHGANHPVKALLNDQVWITSQNHGFAVCEQSLPACLEVTHRSLFDNTLQGLRHTHKPAMGFQGHPEASPGPREAAAFFKDFVESLPRH